MKLAEEVSSLDALKARVDAVEKKIKQAEKDMAKMEALLLRRFGKIEKVANDAHTNGQRLRALIAQVQQQKSR
jgi:flagellar capping protein FliD